MYMQSCEIFTPFINYFLSFSKISLLSAIDIGECITLLIIYDNKCSNAYFHIDKRMRSFRRVFLIMKVSKLKNVADKHSQCDGDHSLWLFVS